MFGKLLIANRGEIAVRIMSTAKRMGIGTVAVYSDADRSALHVEVADEAWRIGPPPAAQSYLDQDAIITAALKSGSDTIHPGYGFLSENPEFAEAVRKVGLVFVGPPAAAIRSMGLKSEARLLMQAAGVPVLPGYQGEAQDDAVLLKEAQRIGFPVIIKPVAGGGGKGMRRVNSAVEMPAELAASRREAFAAFGNNRLLLEKFVVHARHIEVQVVADTHGNIVHLFERDCSLQRRHQKVIEETPAPGMTRDMRQTLCASAIAAARSVNYTGVGTVEFLADVSDGLRADRFYFMEMNTRLQVEHAVTEMVTGLDLVELQLRVAGGEILPIRQNEVQCEGHAIEARLYAEDPSHDFRPQTGRIAAFSFSQYPGLRVDSGVRAGDVVESYYDPLLAKFIVHAPDRHKGALGLAKALANGNVAGFSTNLFFLNRLLHHSSILAGEVETALIARDLNAILVADETPIEAIAAALLFKCGNLAPPCSASPFDTLTGFRLWGGETFERTLVLGGEPRQCQLESRGTGFIAYCGGRSLAFHLLSHDATSLRLACEDRLVELAYFHDGRLLAIALGDARFEVGLEPGVDSLIEDRGGDLVISPMPGLLRRLPVACGDIVERGTTVAIIEAMKMELALTAQRSGKVTEINAREGDQITEGSALLRIGEGNG